MSQSGGARANRSGNSLEGVVEAILKNAGYGKVSRAEYKQHTIAKEPVFVRQAAIGLSIYETALRVDFHVFHPTKFSQGLIIECKWQQSPGSVDEKYPYLLKNLKKFKCPSIVVIDGGGYKPGAEKWLRSQANGNPDLDVFNLMEFQTWVNDGGL